MSKHTPGPWEVTTIGRKLFIAAQRSIAGAQIVATPGGRSEDEWKANARLIAAAPELLEMVRRFGVGDMRLPHTEYEMALRAEARALLARIEEST